MKQSVLVMLEWTGDEYLSECIAETRYASNEMNAAQALTTYYYFHRPTRGC